MTTLRFSLNKFSLTLLTLLAFCLLLLGAIGGAGAQTTTNIPWTDSHVTQGGYWVRNQYGVLSGHNVWNATGAQSEVEIAFTLDSSQPTTTVSVQGYFQTASSIQVSVDGGAYTTVNPTLNTMIYVQVASSLAPGAHTLYIRNTASGSFFIAEDNTFQFVGAVPTMTATIYAGVQYLTSAAYIGGSKVSAVSSQSAYTIKWQTTPLGFYTFRVRATDLWCWISMSNGPYTVQVDGTFYSVNTSGPTTNFQWVHIATGMDGTAFHKVRLTNCQKGGYTLLYSLLPLGGSSPLIDTVYAPASHKFFADLGDSISGGGTYGNDWTHIYTYQLMQSAGGDVLEATGSGYSGYTASQVAGHTADITSLTVAPNYVLVECNTNDMLAATVHSSVITSDTTICNNLLSGLPTTTSLFFLGVMPRSSFTQVQCDSYTADARAAIAACTSPSRWQIIDPRTWNMAGAAYVTGGAGTFTTNFADGVHPNDAGYQIMANNIYSSLFTTIFRRFSLGTGRAGSRSSQ